MKVLVISDTHRNHQNLEKVLEVEKPLDLLIHLGDAEGCEDYIAAIAECEIEVVAGNCDFFSNLQPELIIEVGKNRILMTHGHYYSVNTGMAAIKKEAVARGCNVVMFGHTHRPMVAQEENLSIINPGSLSYPRQDGKHPSYVVMEVDKEETNYTIKYLE